MLRIIPYELMVSHMLDQVKPIAFGKESKQTAQEVRKTHDPNSVRGSGICKKCVRVLEAFLAVLIGPN